MVKYKDSLGKALILWIVGLFPLLFSVIVEALNFPEYVINVMYGVSTFIGGLLCLFVANKEYDIKIKDHNWKLNFRDLIFIIGFSFFYNMSVMSIIRKDLLLEVYGEKDIVPLSLLIGSSIFGPIGEELIYHYGIFSALKGKSSNIFRIIVSILISSIIFMIIHFNFGFIRMIDLFVFGVIACLIFIATKNLLYCIIFHSIANAVVFGSLIFFSKVRYNEKIMFICIPLAVIFGISFFYFAKKKDLAKLTP